MSCCAADVRAGETGTRLDELGYWVVEPSPNRFHLDLLVPDAHCAACIATIERAIAALPGIAAARLNLTTRRLGVEWEGPRDPRDILQTVSRLGYDPVPVDAAALDDADDARGTALVRALAVTGFAAANVMLLSISVWSGAEGATRDLFHWLSALLALPAIVYGGRPFFASALTAVRAQRFNMDVPIALAVVLAAAVSLVETWTGGRHAYFDAAVSLLFFLLLGRVLDHAMRKRARTVASQLLAGMARAVTVEAPDGSWRYGPIESVRVGETIRLSAGERVPLDGTVIGAPGEIDASIATGESLPVPVAVGDAVVSGAINLAGPLRLRVTAAARDGFLARMVALMEEAEAGRANYERLADRIARLYAPVVHILALVTFIGWIALGQGWHPAMMAAIATLIITCPCALGLAVPVVQVVATDLLFREGIMVKGAAALERLSRVDHAVFDKTGTLTLGRMRVAGEPDDEALALAAGLARHSRHPAAVAVARAAKARDIAPLAVENVREIAGLGLEGTVGGRPVRLGRPGWAGSDDERVDDGASRLALSGKAFDTVFTLTDEPRDGLREGITTLESAGIACEVLSGDRASPVRALAEGAGLRTWRAGCAPLDKVKRIKALHQAGADVLFVGDGLNDGPALRAADVSMAPASAADLGRAAADIVFLRGDLRAVPRTVAVARSAMRHVKQNVWLAIAYNMIAVPLAMAGQVTPLVAALAMSGSSILVTANALRLRWSVRPEPAARRVAESSIVLEEARA